tara:strand:- start:762 stop:1151 length:390 start_codon:yes stop_codon:yes gene_type:complete
MPHQCVRCGKLYPAGCKELLEGCGCGGRFFFFVKDDAVEKAQEVTQNLTKKDKKQIESDVLDIVGDKFEDKPVILDFESIKIKKPGQYELDLIDLFKGRPIVYKLQEGKYVIDIISSFSAKYDDEIEVE